MTEVELAAQRVAAVLAVSREAEEIQRLQGEFEAARVAAEAAERAAIELESRKEQSGVMAKAAVEARSRVLDRRFGSLRPLVGNIYRRLDPHPSFTELDLAQDVYNARGATRPIARDPTLREPANPLVVFSTSQANIAALSYFLALGWVAGERALPFVLLDDPLQSMDDVNVLGFADLCRFLRMGRQLIISTHEDRFASLLSRKLTPRSGRYSTARLQFEGWDRSGPTISAEFLGGRGASEAEEAAAE